MKKVLVAGLLAAAFSAAILTNTAEARCADTGTCRVVKPVKKLSAKSEGRRHRAVAAKNPRKASRATARAGTKGGGQVVALIRSMAPSYGVPTWFALRIAQVESGYNPRARGSAGELGVFQLKCATARGIGYRVNCAGLLDARTNVAYGLKHLSLAVKSSRGNLRLAASKHNGGLGRRKIVHGYVAKVF